MEGIQRAIQMIADANTRERERKAERNKLLKLIDKKFGIKSNLKNPEEKLSTKQQILLLEALGVFNNPAINSLSDSKKAKLFSNLLNRGEKLVKDHFTYLDQPLNNSPEKFRTRKKENELKVDEVLTSVGLRAKYKPEKK